MKPYDPPKTHWLKSKTTWGKHEVRIALCGHTRVKYANAKRKVTCLRCQKVMAGYQTKEK